MSDFNDDDEAVQKGGPKAFIDRREQPTRVGLVVPDVRGQGGCPWETWHSQAMITAACNAARRGLDGE